MGLRQRPARHGHRQLEVVRRVGRDEVDRAVRDRRQEGEGIADPHLHAGGIERPRPARIGRAQVRELRTGAVALVCQVADDPLEDGGPARIQLDADGPPRPARDGRSEERPSDPGERIEHELSGPAEELDQTRHQPRRLVGSVDTADGMAELRRVGRGQQRLGEIQPLLAGQLVESVGRVGGSPAVIGHRGQPSGRGDRARCGRPRMSHARHVYERAVRRARGGVRPARHGSRRRCPRPDEDPPARGHGRYRRHPLPRRGDRPDRGPARPDDRPAFCGMAGQFGRAIRSDHPRHRPSLGRAAGRGASRPARSRDVGGRPPPARARSTSRGDRGPDRRRRADGARATPGPDPRRHPRPARAAGGAPPGRPRARGPPSRRRRDAGAGHVPRPDLA